MAKRTSEKMSVTTQNGRRKRCGRWGRGQFKSPPSKRRETYLQVRGPTVKQNESIRRGDVNLRSPAHTHQVIHVWVSAGPIPFPTFHSKPKAAPASALGSRGDPGFRWRDSQGAAFPGLGASARRGQGPADPASASCFLPLVEYRARPQPLAFLHCASPARTQILAGKPSAQCGKAPGADPLSASGLQVREAYGGWSRATRGRGGRARRGTPAGLVATS